MGQTLLTVLVVIPAALVVIAFFAIMWRQRTTQRAAVVARLASAALVPLAFMVHIVSPWQLSERRW